MSWSLLHSSHPVTWDAWHLEPTIIGGAFIVSGAYLYLLRLSPGHQRWRPLAFFAGGTVIFIALASPLDAAADRLLSMHMLQHVALTSLGPPLVLLGLPPSGLQRIIPEGSRRFALLARVTLPFVAGAFLILNMWAWHVPPIYEAALREVPVHVAMHIAFMATGLLFWWPIVAPLPALSTASGGARLLYLFVTGFPMGVLALLLLSSQNVIYDFYGEQPSRLWGFSPLVDQQVAGVIMGSLGEIASFIAFSLIFYRYLLHDVPDGPADAVRESPAI